MIEDILVLNKFCLDEEASIKDALYLIDENHNGLVFLSNKNSQIVSCATDGDIRRALLSGAGLHDMVSKYANYEFIFLFENDVGKEGLLKLLDTRAKLVPILRKDKTLKAIVTKNSFNWNSESKIISKAKSPVRISFAGGGTDITNYFYNNNGVVLNSTINKYAYASLIKRDDAKIIIYSNDFSLKLEFNDIIDLKYDGRLDLIKAVLNVLKPEFGFDLYLSSDVPPGSGLGGSAVMLSAVIGAFNNFREDKYTRYEIAELAFHAERIELDISGGWQDQYATVFGGFNFMEFNEKDNIVHPLRISDELKLELEDSLVLCFTGAGRNSGEIHSEQKDNMSTSGTKEFAEYSKKLAYEMKTRLLKGRLDDFGILLHKAWVTKKQFSQKISNRYLDELYDFAVTSGATGGKLLGAGGGGYFLFYVPSLKRYEFIEALKGRNIVTQNFQFDNEGLKTWISRL